MTEAGDGIQHRLNAAPEACVAGHLKRCDASFVPPLSERVRIDAYAAKLVAHALRFEAWYQQELIGLVAAYPNHELNEMYVTNVSVLASWRHQGIAARLLDRCIENARSRGLKRVVLDVSPENRAGRRLYAALGFVDAARAAVQRPAMVRMTLTLGSS